MAAAWWGCLTCGAANVSDILRTAGAAVAIALTAYKQSVGSTFDDLTYVRARVVDANGVTVPNATHLFRFRVSGSGALVATDNASFVDHNPFRSPNRTANGGKATALVRGAGNGTFMVEAIAEGLRSAAVHLRSRH